VTTSGNKIEEEYVCQHLLLEPSRMILMIYRILTCGLEANTGDGLLEEKQIDILVTINARLTVLTLGMTLT